MPTRLIAIAIVAIAALVLPASAPAASKAGASVKVTDTRFGKMLFDGRGRALYLFTRERSSKPRCYGACAVAWPPFLTNGKPHARKGADSDLLGTVERNDGKKQVTYRGHPLYYYVTDVKPGLVTCQAVDEFGGFWYVVAPNGKAIR